MRDDKAVAILIEETKGSKEADACNNHEAVLVDGLEHGEHESKSGAAGELAGGRGKGDAENGEDGVEELVEECDE